MLAHALLSPHTQSRGQELIIPALLPSQPHTFNVNLARLWIDNCLNNHIKCRRASSAANSEPRLPTRLIDVTDPEHPFLQETESLSNGQYVALSYCWGLGKKFVTLKDNYESFQAKIPSRDLPRTFKDAILAVNSLGYKYIWIDALCIIQNDPEDLKAELQIMGDIYRYAILTICAQGSASSHSGIFQTSRDPLSLAPCRVELTLHINDDNPTGATQEVTIDQTLAGMCTSKDYLTPRGWILQEDILTSRALRFGSQMSWRCLESYFDETRPGQSSEGGHLDPLKVIRGWLYIPESVEDGASTSSPGSDVFVSWYNMVEIYSDKELSFATDTLRALSGISAMFGRVHSVTYLAGLWKEDLVRGLGWYVATNDGRPVVDVNTAKQFNAPSWTWASVGKVRIRFAFLSPGFKSDGVKGYERRGRVLDAYCAWGDPILEGKGKGAGQEWSLRVQGPARRAILRRSARYTEWRIKNRMYASHANDGAFDSSKIASGVYMRFPGLLLDMDNDEVVLGEVALDSGWELWALAGQRGTEAGDALVRVGGGRKVEDEVEDMNVLCLFLDSYGSLPGAPTLCLVVVPRSAGSSSYIRIGLGFLAEGQEQEKQDEDSEMDLEII